MPTIHHAHTHTLQAPPQVLVSAAAPYMAALDTAGPAHGDAGEDKRCVGYCCCCCRMRALPACGVGCYFRSAWVQVAAMNLCCAKKEKRGMSQSGCEIKSPPLPCCAKTADQQNFTFSHNKAYQDVQVMTMAVPLSLHAGAVLFFRVCESDCFTMTHTRSCLKALRGAGCASWFGH